MHCGQEEIQRELLLSVNNPAYSIFKSTVCDGHANRSRVLVHVCTGSKGTISKFLGGNMALGPRLSCCGSIVPGSFLAEKGFY